MKSPLFLLNVNILFFTILRKKENKFLKMSSRVHDPGRPAMISQKNKIVKSLFCFSVFIFPYKIEDGRQSSISFKKISPKTDLHLSGKVCLLCKSDLNYLNSKLPIHTFGLYLIFVIADINFDG